MICKVDQECELAQVSIGWSGIWRSVREKPRWSDWIGCGQFELRGVQG